MGVQMAQNPVAYRAVRADDCYQSRRSAFGPLNRPTS